MDRILEIARVIALPVALVLALAACSSSDTGETPLGDTASETPGAAAGACLEGDPDCNDTGDMNTPGPPPIDDSSGGDVVGSGALPDGGLTISEALATDATGTIAVQGFLVADETGARLCEVLAESYPPQCGGASIPVLEYDEMVDVPLQNAEGVTWTDESLSLFGELVDGVFVVDPTVAG